MTPEDQPKCLCADGVISDDCIQSLENNTLSDCDAGISTSSTGCIPWLLSEFVGVSQIIDFYFIRR